MKDNFNSIFKTFFYLSVTLLHLYMDVTVYKTFPKMNFLYRLLFLTFISFYVNWFYYLTKFLRGIPILNAIPRLFDEKYLKRLFRLAFSLSFVVFILYWGMILLDPKLLFRSGMEIPIHLDLFLHGGNFILNLMEHSLINPDDSYEPSYRSFIVFLVFYFCLLKVCYAFFGILTYPFVDSKNIFFYIAIFCCGKILMFSGDLVFKGIVRVNERRLKIKRGE